MVDERGTPGLIADCRMRMPAGARSFMAGYQACGFWAPVPDPWHPARDG